jgi:hypothetical protein
VILSILVSDTIVTCANMSIEGTFLSLRDQKSPHLTVELVEKVFSRLDISQHLKIGRACSFDNGQDELARPFLCAF